MRNSCRDVFAFQLWPWLEDDDQRSSTLPTSTSATLDVTKQNSFVLRDFLMRGEWLRTETLLCRWPISGNRKPTNTPTRPLNSKEHSFPALREPSVSTSPYTRNGCRRIRHPTRYHPKITQKTHYKRPRAVDDAAVPRPTGEAEIPSPGNTGKRMDRHDDGQDGPAIFIDRYVPSVCWIGSNGVRWGDGWKSPCRP